MNKKIAVTGSSGFIGKYLCELLKSQEFEVIEIDIDKGFDIKDFDTFKLIPDYDFIVHLAAKSYVPDSFVQPHDFYKTNIDGTLNVLESARLNKAKVIFFSSYIYGVPERLPVKETHSKAPHNPYAHSKLLGENLCKAYNKDFGVPVTIFRPFNIYGPNQRSNFLIPTIIEQLGNPEINLLDDKPKRDYIYVTDIVNAILAAIKTDLDGFESFNLGSGKSYSVRDIAETLISISNSKAKLLFANKERKNEVSDCYADISKAKKMLNWEPLESISHGLKMTIKKKI